MATTSGAITPNLSQYFHQTTPLTQPPSTVAPKSLTSQTNTTTTSSSTPIDLSSYFTQTTNAPGQTITNHNKPSQLTTTTATDAIASHFLSSSSNSQRLSSMSRQQAQSVNQPGRTVTTSLPNAPNQSNSTSTSLYQPQQSAFLGLDEQNSAHDSQNSTQHNTNVAHSQPQDTTLSVPQQRQTLGNNTINSQQPPKHPLESVFRYSQLLQIAINSLQSVSTGALTMIQALLMFKHEIGALLFGENFGMPDNNQMNQNFGQNGPGFGPKPSPTLFQRLITRPISSLFENVFTIIDWAVRLLTAGLVSPRGLLFGSTRRQSGQSTAFNALNQHMSYPYNTLQQAQLTEQAMGKMTDATFSRFNSTTGPIIANPPQVAPTSTRPVKSASSSFTTILYYTTVAAGIYICYKQLPIWLKNLERSYKIAPTLTQQPTDVDSMNMASEILSENDNDCFGHFERFVEGFCGTADEVEMLYSHLNSYSANIPLRHVNIDAVVQKLGMVQQRMAALPAASIGFFGSFFGSSTATPVVGLAGFDFTRLHRRLQLLLLQRFNRLHPAMCHYYTENTHAEIPYDVVGLLNQVDFTVGLKPVQRDVASTSTSTNTAATSTTTPHSTQPIVPSGPRKLPSLFDHIDTTETSATQSVEPNIPSFGSHHALSQMNTSPSPQPSLSPHLPSNSLNAANTTLPQVASVVFESDGIIFSIDQLTGQVATSRAQPQSAPQSSSRPERSAATRSKGVLKTTKRRQ